MPNRSEPIDGARICHHYQITFADASCPQIEHPVSRLQGGGHAVTNDFEPAHWTPDCPVYNQSSPSNHNAKAAVESGKVRPPLPPSLDSGKAMGRSCVLVWPNRAGPAQLGDSVAALAYTHQTMTEEHIMPITPRLLSAVDRLFPPPAVHAHCDLPCGVYNPSQARVEAESVKAIMEKYNASDDPYFKERATVIKEQVAGECNRHLDVLWYQYFTPAHLEKYPQLHDLFWTAKKTTSQAKRTNDEAVAQKLLDSIDEIGKIFWETKK